MISPSPSKPWSAICLSITFCSEYGPKFLNCSEIAAEEELGPDDKLTKSGYLQDDFVVDDDEDLDEEYIDDDTDDDEFEDDDEYDSSDDNDEEEFEDEDEENDDVNTENAVSPERKTRKKGKSATVFDLMLPDKDSELSE